MRSAEKIFRKHQKEKLFLTRGRGVIASIAVLFFPYILFAQSFDNYRQFGKEGIDKIREIETMPNGDIIASGTFTENISIGTFDLNAVGNEDLWVARFDENLNVIWAIGGGSIQQDEVADLEISPDGSIFWVVSIWKEGRFGNQTGEQSFSAGFPGKSVFIFGLNNNTGEIESFSVYSGNGSKSVNEIEIDTAGDMFLVGDFSDTLFYSDTFFLSKYESNFFAAKVNLDSGEMIWFQQPEGSGFSNGNTVSVLPSGEIIAAGEFEGEITLGDDSIQTRTPDEDLFYLKLSSEGEPVFLKRAGGVFPAFCKKSVSDSEGNFYLVGTHRGVIRTEDDLQIETTGQNDNFYLLAFRSDGTSIWGRSLGSLGNDEATDLDILDNQLFISGFYENDMEIDREIIPVGDGFFNAFFAGFSKNSGNLNWIQSTVGNEFQTGNCITPVSTTAAVAGFDFSNEIEFGGDVFMSEKFFDFFIAEIIFPEPVSTEKNDLLKLSIYPNPISDYLMIETAEKIFQIEIYSSCGRIAGKFFTQKKIDLKSIPPGLYFLKIETSSGAFAIEKFVKK